MKISEQKSNLNKPTYCGFIILREFSEDKCFKIPSIFICFDSLFN